MSKINIFFLKKYITVTLFYQEHESSGKFLFKTNYAFRIILRYNFEFSSIYHLIHGYSARKKFDD